MPAPRDPSVSQELRRGAADKRAQRGARIHGGCGPDGDGTLQYCVGARVRSRMQLARQRP